MDRSPDSDAVALRLGALEALLRDGLAGLATIEHRLIADERITEVTIEPLRGARARSPGST
jgi:hypothetical protein